MGASVYHVLVHTNIFSWFRYSKVTERGLMSVSSSNLKVGDIIVVEKGVRVPADLVLLRYITLTFLWKPLFNLNITGSELVQEFTGPPTGLSYSKLLPSIWNLISTFYANS